MINLNVVTISRGGALSPERIQVQRGDIVAFRADGTDVVLCFDRAAFFGAYRYEIRSGQTLPLVVQGLAPAGVTAYSVKTNLAAECFPRSAREGTIHIGGAPGTGDGGGTPRAVTTIIDIPDDDGDLPALNVNPGASIQVRANGVDVLLCFPDADVFGVQQVVMPAGTVHTLTALANAPAGPFKYSVVFDLTAECDDDRGEDGRGTVGGGGGGGN